MSKQKNKTLPLVGVEEKQGEVKHYKLNPNTKRASILKQFIELGAKGMNCFEAANRHHDYVLRSTVSDIQREYGIWFDRKMEQVPNAFGKTTDCMRYWLCPKERTKALNLLGDQA